MGNRDFIMTNMFMMRRQKHYEQRLEQIKTMPGGVCASRITKPDQCSSCDKPIKIGDRVITKKRPKTTPIHHYECARRVHLID